MSVDRTPKKSLILCVHAHQPVGNFDWVFAESFDRSYEPFLSVLEKHPSAKICMHISGSLLDWIIVNRPAFIERLRARVSAGQVELLGGAYYEPIYGLIPRKDLDGQIQMMGDRMKRHFGVVPEGVWLTERVWDPELVSPLAKAGIKYTVLDDFHFERAGKKTPITGYYASKGPGKTSIDLFSSVKQLRYLIPFQKPEEAISHIRSMGGGPEDAVIFADDCEKFGLWPGTYEWVFGSGAWLDRFFTLLKKDTGIRLYTFSEFRRAFSPKAVLKVPHASYGEMMEWSGGRFYNFFKKYSESDYMRDRMVGVSRRLGLVPSTNGTARIFARAQETLYKAQCNCSYWHGVFGGLYLHHLRSSVFENLIRTEKTLASIPAYGERGPVVTREKMDSGERLRVRQPAIVSFFNPGYGASLEELDYLPKGINLMCNLQRRQEPYHAQVLKGALSDSSMFSIYQMLGTREEGLEGELHYDRYRRLSFMDHFFAGSPTLSEFVSCSYKEAGDFVGARYTAAIRNGREIEFRRRGALSLTGRRRPLEICKRVIPDGARSLNVRYTLRNTGSSRIRFTMGVECNFSIGETSVKKGLSESGLRERTFFDSWRKVPISLGSTDSFDLLAGPVETVSESESGLGKTYQGLGVLLCRTLEIEPEGSKEFAYRLEVG